MPRRPVILGPRPTETRCSCGAVIPVAPRGPLPTACAACDRRRSLGVEVRWRVEEMLADPLYRSSEAGRDAALLRALADRLDPIPVVDQIEELAEGLDLAVVPPERARGVARTLNRVRMALVRALGRMV